MEVEVSKLVPLSSSVNMMDGKSFHMLVERVKAEGVKAIEPIIVCRPSKDYVGKVLRNSATGDEVECREDSFLVVDGWHRVAACKIAEISRVPAVEVAPGDVVLDGFVANLVRGSVSWPLFYKVYRKGEIGGSVGEIAKYVDVKDILQAGEVSEAVIDYMLEVEKKGACKFTPRDILLVSKVSDLNLQREYAVAITGETSEQKKKETLKAYMLRENVMKKGVNIGGEVGKKIVDMLRRGDLRSNRAVEAIAESETWVREDLTEALKRKSDGEVDLIKAKVVEEKNRERDELTKILPEEARAKAEEYKSVLSVRMLKAALKIPDPKKAAYFIEEAVQGGYSDSQAEDAAGEILEEMQHRERKIPPLTRTLLLEDQVFHIPCPNCGGTVEVETKTHKAGEPYVEILVHKKYGEDVLVKAPQWQDKRFEEYLVEGGRRLRIQVDYVARTFTVKEDTSASI